MRLVMYYSMENDNKTYCEWKRITKEDETLKIVIDFVRTLNGWEHCIFCGFIKYGMNIDKGDEAKAFFLQSIKDAEESERITMNVTFHIDLEHKETTTREEFCTLIERLYAEEPPHIRKLFTDFAMDPETSDADLEQVMNTLMTTLMPEDCSQV